LSFIIRPTKLTIAAGVRVLGMVNEEDYIGSRTVLRAAAMTYVAALATAVASLLRVLLIANRRR
jgi:Zn-dependent membrane protease YugP